MATEELKQFHIVLDAFGIPLDVPIYKVRFQIGGETGPDKWHPLARVNAQDVVPLTNGSVRLVFNCTNDMAHEIKNAKGRSIPCRICRHLSPRRLDKQFESMEVNGTKVGKPKVSSVECLRG